MAKLAQWRATTTAQTWKAVTRKFNDAGVRVTLLCYNMQDSMKTRTSSTVRMAKGLGVKGITTSTTLTMAKRIAPVADRHKLMVGYHGHDATKRSQPDRPLSRATNTLMSYGKYNASTSISATSPRRVRRRRLHPAAPR